MCLHVEHIQSAVSASRVSYLQHCGEYIHEPLQLDMHGRPEEPKQSDNDEVDGNDVVEQPRDDQDQNAREQRDQGARTQTHTQVHGALRDGVMSAMGFNSQLQRRRGVGVPQDTRS